MKGIKKVTARVFASMAARFAALVLSAALAFGMAACSNSSGGTPLILKYTITFNANDGSQSPATATQIFMAGTPQNLKTIAELGFKKDGFNFAGWGTSSSASESSYADGASFTATADTPLYALWSVQVYSVSVSANANGSVAASPATAAAGTEVTLSNTPNEGYHFASYTVTDADGGAVAVTDGKFTMPAKNVTVTATFTIYAKIDTVAINGTQYDIVTFGAWPQTIKAANVDVSEQGESKTAGEFTYYKGSDGQWYAKVREEGYGYGNKYSDGTAVKISSDKSYRWFKVEPIKWRVLTTDYNGTGKKLLLAENILIVKYYGGSGFVDNYQNSWMRKWLNSNADYDAAASDYGDSKGFLKTAFTSVEIAKIADARVDNSERSTLPDNYDSLADNIKQHTWHNGYNPYASDTPTTDKVFLLSEQEVTKSAYGFDAYDAWKGDRTHNESSRIRQTTDYARASGAIYETDGGIWWLRSPFNDNSDSRYARIVHFAGKADGFWDTHGHPAGGVPALCLDD